MTPAEIDETVASAGLNPLTPGQSAQFSTYLDLLLKWNAKLNLTAVREPEAIVRRHFLESIQCAQVLPPIAALLDFGSGAGFPGMPIAICRPEIKVTLGESQAKKASFLREAARILALEAEIFDGRIENMPPGRIFDAVALRAVDKMADSLRAAAVRVKAGGWLAIFSTEGTAQEHRDLLPQIQWKPPVHLIGSHNRVLLIGQNVPRET